MKKYHFVSILMVTLGLGGARGQDAVAEQLHMLAEQNARLQQQVQAQQQALDALAGQLAELRRGEVRRDEQVQELRNGPKATRAMPAFSRETDLRLTGEVGLAFFRTGRDGVFPKAQFRADDTKLCMEAPVVKDVYAFGEINLTTREAESEYFEIGEFYIDLENVSGRLGGPARLLNLRFGRVNTPFGEEYQVRGPIANPLILHSLGDVWGVDAGLEAYGETGAWRYAVAVQNGGNDALRDFNADKAVTAYLGWNPARWLHLSASATRTGELRIGQVASPGDALSSLWFGNGYFRSLGSDKTTTTFWASLWECDAAVRWKSGHLAAALGGAAYGDNDRSGDNSRQLHFGYVEATRSFTPELFGAVRHSWIEAPRGYALAGMGEFERFFYGMPTTALRRTSIGFGYRLGPPLILKLEYAWESGRLLNGAPRDQENFFGAEAALKF